MRELLERLGSSGGDSARAESFIRVVERNGELDALVEMMNNLASAVRSGTDQKHAAGILAHDIGAELAAAVKMGDVSSQREFKELEGAILGFGKAILGKNAPRKLAYPSHHRKAIERLGSAR